MNIPEDLDVNIQPLDLFKLMDDAGNLYKAVIIMSKRANQLSVQQKQEIMSEIAGFSSYLDSVDEIIENREQIEISRRYERMPKPTIVALYEYQNHLIRWKE